MSSFKPKPMTLACIPANNLADKIGPVLLKTKKYVDAIAQAVGHDILIDKFVDSVRNNSALPVTTDDARETVRIVESISTSY
jgi:hypothetical protein